jgi:transposase
MDMTSETTVGAELKASPPHKLPPKRTFPVEFKRRVVEETMQPGAASVSVIARRNDVNSNLVFTWRKLYRAGLLGGGDQSFIQVGVVGSLPFDRSAGLIELELPGGIRLRIDSRIEEAVLQRVLRAVKSCA